MYITTVDGQKVFIKDPPQQSCRHKTIILVIGQEFEKYQCTDCERTFNYPPIFLGEY